MEQKIIQNSKKQNIQILILWRSRKNKDLNQKNYSEIVDNFQSEYIKNNDAMAGSSIAQDDYHGKNDHTKKAGMCQVAP